MKVETLSQLEHIIERLQQMDENWDGFHVLELSIFCTCGEEMLHCGWPDIRLFAHTHLKKADKGHRVRVDFMMRLRNEVILDRHRWLRTVVTQKGVVADGR